MRCTSGQKAEGKDVLNQARQGIISHITWLQTIHLYYCNLSRYFCPVGAVLQHSYLKAIVHTLVLLFGPAAAAISKERSLSLVS